MRYFMKKRGKLISSISACLALVLMFTSTINGAELVTSDDYVADETVNAAKGTAYGTAGFVTVPKSKQSSKQKTVTSTTLIVIPDNATEAEEFAAKLIREYVAGIDGSDIEIVRDSEQIGTNYEIYIGNTVNRPHADLTGKADGCYSIRTYNNNSISIYGAGSRGTVAGAYAFLEKFGGYKFYCSEEGYKTSATHLKISGKTDIKYTPAFEVADTNYMASFSDETAKRDYTLRAGLEGTSVESGLLEGLESDLYLLNCVESLSSGDVDTIKAEISDALNSPEYDANAALQIIRLDAYNLEDTFAYNFNGKTTDVDAVFDKANFYSKYIKNQGAENVKLEVCIYGKDSVAPDSFIKKKETLNSNVIVRLCPYDLCEAHAITDKKCKENYAFYKNLKDWVKVAPTLYVTDYTVNFMQTLPTFTCISALQTNIKAYKKAGVKGIFVSGNNEFIESDTSFGELKAYLVNEILKNPSVDLSSKRTAFLKDYYGKKSYTYINNYIKTMDSVAKKNHITVTDMTADMYGNMPKTNKTKCENLLNNAVKKAKNDTEFHQKNIFRVQLGWRYIKSTLGYKEFAPATFAASNEALAKDFVEVSGNEVMRLGQGGIIYPCADYMNKTPDYWTLPDDIDYMEDPNEGITIPTEPVEETSEETTEDNTEEFTEEELQPSEEETELPTEDEEETTSEEPSSIEEEATSEEPSSIEEETTSEEPSSIEEDPIEESSSEEPSEEPRVEEPISEITEDTEYVTYKMFGAKGDGKTDDYAAIVATHAYANANNLPVKADKGAVYYVCKMDSNNKAGALVKTNTDWTGAEFIIDDRYIDTTDRNQGECFLFTIAPSVSAKKMWYLSSDGKLGLDPSLSTYPTYPDMSKAALSSMKNKTFTKNTTKLEGNFGERALYLLESNDEKTKRWARQNFSETARNQTEILLVNADGTIDPSTPITWDWDNIWMITKYTIDETPLTVKGGKFTTRIALPDYGYYLNRGLHITRSNAVVEGVEHYLDESGFDPKGFDKDGYVLEQGSQYYGFFQVDNCAYTTMKNCIMSDRAFVHNKDGSRRSSYEFTSTNSAAFTLKDCTMATPINNNEYRYGTIGTNGCKSLVVDGSTVSRVDAHMGVYNMTVKNSTLGQAGVRAAGFGDLVIENVTTSSEYFLVLRDDFGGAWYGDVTIKNCTWVLNNDHPKYMYPKLIIAKCDPTFNFSYDVQDGYYTQMMSHLTVDGLTLDYSNNTQSNLYGIFAQGLEIFGTISPAGKEYSETNMNNPNIYKYARKAPEEVTVRNLKVIKPQSLNTPSLKNKTMPVFLKKSRPDGNMAKDEVYFFRNTVFNNDESTHVEVFADK